MRNSILHSTVFVCACVLFAAQNSDLAQAGSPDLTKQIKQKLEERVAVLEKVVKYRMAAFKAGHATIDTVLLARNTYLFARLDLAKSVAQRIKILEAHLQNARELEKVVQRLVKAKQLSEVDYLQAKAYRLEAEAVLLKEQSANSAARQTKEGTHYGKLIELGKDHLYYLYYAELIHNTKKDTVTVYLLSGIKAAKVEHHEHVYVKTKEVSINLDKNG